MDMIIYVPLCDQVKFTFEESQQDNIKNLINNDFNFAIHLGHLYIYGLQPDKMVSIYSIDGIFNRQLRSNDKGDLHISGLIEGFYILKVDNNSFKFLIK